MYGFYAWLRCHPKLVDGLLALLVLGFGLSIYGSWARHPAIILVIVALAVPIVFRREYPTAAERARIARELHDIVAHHVSVMVVQADGAAFALESSPDKTREALGAISGTGRQALAEMRRLLGMLRSPAAGPDLAPVPGTSQLSALLEQTRTAGLPVSFGQEGTPAASRPGQADGADLAVYRVVQEALTNVRRHGGPGVSAAVSIRYTADGVTVSVTDDGRGAAALPAGAPPPEAGQASADGTGHGLPGMRERVELYGGTVTAGPRPGGGYQVTATLPLMAAQLTRGAA